MEKQKIKQDELMKNHALPDKKLVSQKREYATYGVVFASHKSCGESMRDDATCGIVFVKLINQKFQ